MNWRIIDDCERVAAGDEFQLPFCEGWQPIYPEMVGKTRAEINAETTLIPCRYLRFRRQGKQSTAEVELRFRAQLTALLVQWNATLSAEDHYQGYPECGEDVRMTVSIPSLHDATTGETTREYTEIDLGRYLHP